MTQMKIVIVASVLAAVLGWWALRDAQAATYCVDWDNGNNGNSGLYNGGISPGCWREPWYADNQLTSGDTVYLYEVNGGAPYTCVGNSCDESEHVILATTANVTWIAVPGETVRISRQAIYPGTGWTGGGAANNVIWIDAANVVLDGFYIWGQIGLSQRADGSIIQNNDLSGGDGGRDNFAAVIYLHGSISGSTLNDPVQGVLIRNNKLHDNIIAPAYPNGNNAHLIMSYGSRDTIIENNEFHNSVQAAIFWKQHTGRETLRYNYFHDTDAIQGCSSYCDLETQWIDVYQNIFVSGTAILLSSNGGKPYMRIRNNTFYNGGRDVYWNQLGLPAYFESFNNIEYHTGTGQLFYRLDQGWTAPWYVYLNYNNYFSSGTTNWNINGANRASTLSGWKAWLNSQGAGVNNGDVYSVDANPNFVDASGTFSLPEDFKRSNYPTNGRGGGWPSVMGAYITGNEIIGVSGNLIPPDTIPPSSPTGLVVN